MWYDDGLEATDRANQAALLLAHERFIRQFAPFVKGIPARLAYVEDQIAQMIEETCKETNGDVAYVKSRFDSFIADTMKIDPEGLPNVKNVTGDEGLEGVEHTDVMDRGEVPGAGADEAREVDEVQDLGQYTGGWSLSEYVGQQLPESVLTYLKRHSDADWDDSGARGIGTGLAEETEPVTVPAENMPYVCTICGREDSHDAILAHVQQDHADVLQRAQEEGLPMAAKTAEQEPAEVQPLPESPADRFETHVQELAERAAARKFSMPDEETIHSVASQLGVSVDDVRGNLVSVAMFGNNIGVNGELGGEGSPPEGFTEISVQGVGSGQQQAIVPTDLIINKVAEEMNLERDLAYNQIRDRYGADLPDRYHAQVNGEIHFYLPAELAANQTAQTPGYDPNVGPTMQPAPQQVPQPV